MTRIVFRVNGSSQIGLGHLMRCQALAQAVLIAKPNIELIFLVNWQAQQLCESRQDWVGSLHLIPDSLDEAEELQWLTDYIAKQNINAVVLDGYEFSTEYRKRLFASGAYVACFDDTNSHANLYCHLVINGATDADTLNYASTAPDATLCIGKDYRVMRQEFSQLSVIPIETRPYLTIVMGGSDPLNLTLPIINLLESINFDGRVQVITGAAYTNLNELKRKLAKTPLSVCHCHNSQNMAHRFSQSKLVVSAAGGSQFELQACGSPSILVVVADNQILATKEAAKQGWCQTFDVRQHADKEVLTQTIRSLWNQPQMLQQMSHIAYQSADTKGAMRIAKRLIEQVNQ